MHGTISVNESNYFVQPDSPPNNFSHNILISTKRDLLNVTLIAPDVQC